MIKDPKLLTKTLLDYLKSQLVVSKKNGVVVHFDGTLMSAVNISLLKQLGEPFTFKIISCIFNSNKYYLLHLTTIAEELGFKFEIKDLNKDLDTLAIWKNSEGEANEIAIKRRLSDLMLNIEADKGNSLVVGNQCYSQWCIGYPHKNYQNLEQVHLLNRLYYSELKELAIHLDIPSNLVEREPSHYLFRSQHDKKILGFGYDDLEDYLRNAKKIRSEVDREIRDRLIVDNRHRFLNPTIQRPSSLLA